MKNWFDVDVNGLRKVLDARGKEFAVFELVSNAWDEGATEVRVTLEPVSPGVAKLEVRDNSPKGWAGLHHAWTMFAESPKKGDAEKRGRFDVGEKLVLALCTSASIRTMNGTITFGPDGRTVDEKDRLPVGTIFTAMVRLRKQEVIDVLESAWMLIPPAHALTKINGVTIADRAKLRRFEETLPTVIADVEGNLRPSARQTTVTVYKPLAGEKAHLYEMGIPVVEIECPWHIDVGQKVPLNADRTNVTPAYLRKVLACVLNACAGIMSEQEAAKPWVQEAAGSPEATVEAVKTVLDKQYGERRVMFDPSDPEGNKLAMSQGYTVVHGRSVAGGVMENIRKFRDEGQDVLPPAGQVTPSPEAYSKTGKLVEEVDPKDYTEPMARVVDYTKSMLTCLLGIAPRVKVMKTNNFAGAWCPSLIMPEMHFGLNRLGKEWFRRAATTRDGLVELDALIIHEAAHHLCTDHLSEEYYKATCRLGALWKAIVMETPALGVVPMAAKVN